MSGNVLNHDAFSLAALAVAAGRSDAETAALAGVCDRTIRRWRVRPAFAAMVNRLREQLLADGMGKLAAAFGGAAEVLAGLLSSAVEQTRLQAAGKIIDAALRTQRQLVTDRQLEEIRAMAAEIQEKEAERAGPGGPSRSSN